MKNHYSINVTNFSPSLVSSFHLQRMLRVQAMCIHTQLILAGMLITKRQNHTLLCVVRQSILEMMQRKWRIQFQQPMPVQLYPRLLRSIVQLRIEVENLLATSWGVYPQHLETVSTIIIRISKVKSVKKTMIKFGSKLFHQKSTAAYEHMSVSQSKIYPKQLTQLYFLATIPSKQSRITLTIIIIPET